MIFTSSPPPGDANAPAIDSGSPVPLRRTAIPVVPSRVPEN